jgi:hypothetical protein
VRAAQPPDFVNLRSGALEALALVEGLRIRYVYDSYMESGVGIVNIDDDLHDQIRKASAVSCRSINAQAAFWIKVGMSCEMNPTLSFNEIVTGELRGAGIKPKAVKRAST